MFLYLGGEVVVPVRELVGIFDLRMRVSPLTTEFLSAAREEGIFKVVVGQERAKSLVVTTREIYLSPVSCHTLKRRACLGPGRVPPFA
ncbi:MAG: DUF370 domain-containing protein [Firmicutes bacterium]|nr:DUF370 domain-containing protein [Bacillota bacterium]